jgi:hypothetical protein
VPSQHEGLTPHFFALPVSFRRSAAGASAIARVSGAWGATNATTAHLPAGGGLIELTLPAAASDVKLWCMPLFCYVVLCCVVLFCVTLCYVVHCLLVCLFEFSRGYFAGGWQYHPSRGYGCRTIRSGYDVTPRMTSHRRRASWVRQRTASLLGQCHGRSSFLSRQYPLSRWWAFNRTPRREHTIPQFVLSGVRLPYGWLRL